MLGKQTINEMIVIWNLDNENFDFLSSSSNFFFHFFFIHFLLGVVRTDNIL